MADSIGVEITGAETLLNTLKRLVAPEVYMRGLRRVGQSIIDEASIYPPKNSVSRKQAYGSSFSSDKQHRFFFSALRSGTIQVPYRRRAETRGGWQMLESGLTIQVVNRTQGARYAHGEETQARLLELVGWRKLSAIVEVVNKRNSVVEIMNDEINKELRGGG